MKKVIILLSTLMFLYIIFIFSCVKPVESPSEPTHTPAILSLQLAQIL